MRKDVALPKGGDVERRGHGVGDLRDAGGIICYDKELV